MFRYGHIIVIITDICSKINIRGVIMKKWSVPSMVTVSAEKLSEVMVASACTLYNANCVLIRALGD